MIKEQQELVLSLHRSVEHVLSILSRQIVTIFSLIKTMPPVLHTDSIVDYAQLIEKLLMSLAQAVPKVTVPLSHLRESQEECERMFKEQRRMRVELDVLQQKIREGVQREHALKKSYELSMKNNNFYRQKAQSLKRSGEQSIRNIIEAARPQGRQSLPRLDKKEKLSLLWLMRPTPANVKLANHLVEKVEGK